MALATKQQTTELLNKITNDLHKSIERHAQKDDHEMEKIHRQMKPFPKDLSPRTVRQSAYIAAYSRMY